MFLFLFHILCIILLLQYYKCNILIVDGNNGIDNLYCTHNNPCKSIKQAVINAINGDSIQIYNNNNGYQIIYNRIYNRIYSLIYR